MRGSGLIRGYLGWGLWGILCSLAVAATAEVSLASSPKSTAEAASARQEEVQANYGRLPLHFIVNLGQVDREVQFYARQGGSSIFLTREGLVLTLPETGKDGAETASRKTSRTAPGPASRRQMAVRLTPASLSPAVKLEVVEPLPGRVNYFVGKDPQKWRSDIPTYGAVLYREAYPGIDLKFYGNGRQLEYDIILRPGADPSRVKFRCQGVKGLEVTPTGDLLLKLPGGGELVQKKPLIYQEIGGKRQLRTGGFRVQRTRDGYDYGFTLAAYDPRHPLIIDPVLVYSTYLGGESVEFGYGIALDESGCAYVTGTTGSSIDFPTKNPYQSGGAGLDAFVTKLSSGGNDLVYSTYLGGSNTDYSNAIAVNGAGCAYVTGFTSSSDFPIKNALQGTYGGSTDAFVTKLSPAGNELIYSTYLGSEGLEEGFGIAVDGAGCAYVTGYTNSSSFPTKNAYRGYTGGEDVFVTKLEPGGDTLAYSTYLGGERSDRGYAIAVDKVSSAYVTGNTNSSDFPSKNAYQEYKGSEDVFVTKLSPEGDTLAYSTFLGGSDLDKGYGIALDGAGCAYVTGGTLSVDFPTKNAYQGYKGSLDAFVTKLNPGGNDLIYSTFLGGSNWERGYGIAVDRAGQAYVTGRTDSSDFPTKDAYQEDQGVGDVFVTKLSVAGNFLIFSTYLGGENWEVGYGIALDRGGYAYVTGGTVSVGFPTKNAYQGDLKGDNDVFIAKLGQPHVPIDLLLLD